MAKKHSVKSYLMMARYHRPSSKKETNTSSKSSSQQREASAAGRENFGAQTADDSPTPANSGGSTDNNNQRPQIESRGLQCSSIAGDSSTSGYLSSANGGGAPTRRLAMVNESIPARNHAERQQQQPPPHHHHHRDNMWPVMIDDDDDDDEHHFDGGHGEQDGAGEQHRCGHNKVHLIDEGGGIVDSMTMLAAASNDAAAAAADLDDEGGFDLATREDNNNISGGGGGGNRFLCADAQRRSHCVDSKSGRFQDEPGSFQLERRRHLYNYSHDDHDDDNHHHHHHHHPQYFHPGAQNSHHFGHLGLQASQFQPKNFHHQQQQQLGLLNGPALDRRQQQQQQQRLVSYVRQEPPASFGDHQYHHHRQTQHQHQYPVPPANYIQQQYHQLTFIQPPSQHLAHNRSSTNPKQQSSSGGGGGGGSSDTSSSSLAYLHSTSGRPLINNNHHHHHHTHSNQPSLAPSGKMQPAGSRQHLANLDQQQQQQQQQSQHNTSSSRRKQQQLQNGQQTRRSAGKSQSTAKQQAIATTTPTPTAKRAALNCCGKLAKLSLFATNLLFWSAGIALAAWGILSLVEDHKYNLSQLLVFEPQGRMSLFQLLAWSFITLGCATVLVALCGCSAILKNNRWILGLYIFLVLAIFALDLATGLLAIIFQEKLVANVRLRLANKLRADYGVQASFTAAIDYIQTRFECCGLEGHFDYDQSVWRLQRLGGFEATVARTCCHLRNTFDDQAHINPRPVNESMCQSTDVRFHQSYRYRKGCLDDLERLVRQKIWTFTLGCAAVGGVILISLMFATCFCRSIQSYNAARKESSSSNGSPKVQDGGNSKSTRHLSATGQLQQSPQSALSSQRHHHHQHHHR